MWMSDKPAIQQELSRSIASLISVISDQNVLGYMEGFWTTMTREWSGIDRLRLDKFYFLMKQMLIESLKWILKGEQVSERVSCFSTVLYRDALTSNNGVCLFVIEHFVGLISEFEMLKVENILSPLYAVIRNCDFNTVLNKTQAEFKKLKELDIDTLAVADTLFEIGADPQTSGKNRKIVYDLSKFLSDKQDQENYPPQNEDQESYPPQNEDQEGFSQNESENEVIFKKRNAMTDEWFVSDLSLKKTRMDKAKSKSVKWRLKQNKVLEFYKNQPASPLVARE